MIPEFIHITWIQKSKSHFLNSIHTNQVSIHYKYISISLILLLLPLIATDGDINFVAMSHNVKLARRLPVMLFFTDTSNIYEINKFFTSIIWQMWHRPSDRPGSAARKCCCATCRALLLIPVT